MEKSNPIIGFWRTIAECGMSLYSDMIKDGNPVECVPMATVFTPDQMEFIKQEFKPKQKQCFRNCSELVGLLTHPYGKILLGFDGAEYVDGYVYEPGLFPIEHAFVKIGDRYIDPTFELVLGIDVTKCSYMSLLELKWAKLWPILKHRGFYGPLYQWNKENRLQGKKRKNNG